MPSEESRNRGSCEAVAHAGVIGVDEFSDLFRTSFRILWLTAAGIVGNRSLADDVVQEAAMIAYEKREQFQPGTSFSAWMSQIVRYTALNYGRREKRSADAVGDTDLLDRGSERRRGPPTPELRLTPGMQLPVDQVQLDDRIVNALSEVNEIARTCLLLRVIEGLEYREIAKVLDLPEGTAMSHVHRTRQFLRERLADAFGRPDPS